MADNTMLIPAAQLAAKNKAHFPDGDQNSQGLLNCCGVTKHRRHDACPNRIQSRILSVS
jgi:hypothetical protein